MGRGAFLLLLLGGCGFEAAAPAQPNPDEIDAPSGGVDAKLMVDGAGSGSSGCTAAFRAFATATAGSGSDVDVNTPVGTTTGDVMLAAILYLADFDEPVNTVTAPPGWSLIRSDARPGNGAIGQSTFWKVASVGEPSTQTFTGQGGSKRFNALIQSYSGIDVANPILADSGQASAQSTTVAAPSITVADCSTVVGMFGSKTISTFSPPTSMTERADVSNNAGATISLEGTDEVMNGTTGVRAAAATLAGDNIGQLIALRPAP